MPRPPPHCTRTEMDGNNGIKVVVRLRPLNKKETSEGTLPVVTSSTAEREVTLIRGAGKNQNRSTFKCVHAAPARAAQAVRGTRNPMGRRGTSARTTRQVVSQSARARGSATG